MFQVSLDDVNEILRDYGFTAAATQMTQLQRYNYEKDNPHSKEVRLIVRVYLEDDTSVVIRFKKERDVTLEIIQQQCQFAQLLYSHGIPTPVQYQCENQFVKCYTIHGYEVMVCVEEFVEGQLTVVDEEIARKTGVLLAQTHSIAEHSHAHVENAVLFDPFQKNDLCFVLQFEEMSQSFQGEACELGKKIMKKCREYMEVIAPLREEPRYAVQGDISDCNLYQTSQGEIGMFDFNRCGDNNLYCDAVMQAIFEARLMDYPDTYQGEAERMILPAFLEGYQSVRPFHEHHKKMLPYLYTIITSFWAIDLVWSEHSLQNELERGNVTAVERWLHVIWKRISQLPTVENLLCHK